MAARQAQVAAVLLQDETRGRRLEVEGREEAIEEEELSDAEQLFRLGRALIKDGAWNDALGKLSRHEAALLNALRKTLILPSFAGRALECRQLRVTMGSPPQVTSQRTKTLLGYM